MSFRCSSQVFNFVAYFGLNFYAFGNIYIYFCIYINIVVVSTDAINVLFIFKDCKVCSYMMYMRIFHMSYIGIQNNNNSNTLPETSDSEAKKISSKIIAYKKNHRVQNVYIYLYIPVYHIGLKILYEERVSIIINTIT